MNHNSSSTDSNEILGKTECWMIKKIVQYRFILDLGFKDSELVLAVGTDRPKKHKVKAPRC